MIETEVIHYLSNKSDIFACYSNGPTLITGKISTLQLI